MAPKISRVAGKKIRRTARGRRNRRRAVKALKGGEETIGPEARRHRGIMMSGGEDFTRSEARRRRGSSWAMNGEEDFTNPGKIQDSKEIEARMHQKGEKITPIPKPEGRHPGERLS